MTAADQPPNPITLPDLSIGNSEFPSYAPASANDEFAAFLAAMRRFQSLVISCDADDQTWRAAAEQLDTLSATIEAHHAPEGVDPAGRSPHLPGTGNPLIPAWNILRADSDGVTLHEQFSRYHLGGNNIVYGGALPLLFDCLFALTNIFARRPLARNAYLHVDYRQPIPIDTDLRADARLDSVDGRKTVLSATLIDIAGRVMAEASTLLIEIQSHNR